jgi:hypothetical protein
MMVNWVSFGGQGRWLKCALVTSRFALFFNDLYGCCAVTGQFHDLPWASSRKKSLRRCLSNASAGAAELAFVLYHGTFPRRFTSSPAPLCCQNFRLKVLCPQACRMVSRNWILSRPKWMGSILTVSTTLVITSTNKQIIHGSSITLTQLSLTMIQLLYISTPMLIKISHRMFPTIPITHRQISCQVTDCTAMVS